MKDYQSIRSIGEGGKRSAGGYVWVADVARSMQWYKDTLDLDGYPYPSKEPYVYANLSAEEVDLAFVLMSPEGYRHAIPDAPVDKIPPCVVEIDVDDVAGLHATLQVRVPIHTPLGKGTDGRKRFAIEDPDHHVLVFRGFQGEAG